jgi:hypothetical protein
VIAGTRRERAASYSAVVMTRKLITASIASLAAVAGAAAVPAVASAAPADVTGLTLSPSCAAPGQTVTATVTVSDTTYYPQEFYAQDWVSDWGITLERGSVDGPLGVAPYAPLSDSVSAQIPPYTPYGYYTINVGVGPSSSSPTSWSSASAGLTVSPWCF